jgi:hypothetical protein
MYACQHCQELLLDHLYDLLPEAEQASLLAHLQTCSACRQALAQARAQQQLLATAAKRTFPEVTFHKPEPTAVAEPTPPTLPPRVASQAAVSRWYTLAAFAAGLLLCLGSVQVWYLRSQQHAQREQVAQLLAVTREQLREEQQNQRQEIESLERDLRQELQQLQNQADSQHLRLVVTGPRHLPPGTPAEYTVQTFDRQGKPLEALVQVEVDRANASALTRRRQLEDRSSPPPCRCRLLRSFGGQRRRRLGSTRLIGQRCSRLAPSGSSALRACRQAIPFGRKHRKLRPSASPAPRSPGGPCRSCRAKLARPATGRK